MSSVVGALTGGGGSGTGFVAKSASLLNPATVAQADTQYQNAQDALAKQNQFLQALQGQNGIANQSNVFNQLQNVASGQGPNPAQAMLANSTGANTANQAALMAGQRGAGANPALIARQAAMQGGANQQNAAGQAAALQAQQSLGALGQLGGIAGQQVAQQQQGTLQANQLAQNEQNQILNQINAQNQAAIGNASQQNSANASLANTVAGQQGNLVGNLMGAAGSGAQMIPGLFGGSAAAAPMAMAGGAADAGGLASLAPLALAAEGGMIHKYASGGNIEQDSKSPMSFAGKHFTGQGIRHFADGGKVPALVSPGETYIPPKDVTKVKQGANPLQIGERIPGKPKYPGNDYRNDTVPATLEEGGIVIPNAVMQSKNPSKKAAEFVAAHLKMHSLKKGK